MYSCGAGGLLLRWVVLVLALLVAASEVPQKLAWMCTHTLAYTLEFWAKDSINMLCLRSCSAGMGEGRWRRRLIKLIGGVQSRLALWPQKSCKLLTTVELEPPTTSVPFYTAIGLVSAPKHTVLPSEHSIPHSSGLAFFLIFTIHIAFHFLRLFYLSASQQAITSKTRSAS
ncbi:hypothetical protein BJV74DRAFT_190530 [Russula compacta]|nr:hypothetical protein BJV74DRAFT_190530 [Russula compacta]